MTKGKFTYDKDSFVVFSTKYDKHYTFLITFDMQLSLNFTYLSPCKNCVDIYNHIFAQLNSGKVTRLVE